MDNIYTSKNIPSYFEWLKNIVDPFVDRGNHERFFEVLHSMAYVPILDLDHNREMDGVGLRDIYVRGYGIDCSEIGLVLDSPCSVLEFLVALAQRMDYIFSTTDRRYTTELFWEILHNIGLGYQETTDDIFEENPEAFEDRVYLAFDRVLNRSYEPDGTGNLFPLKNPEEDQRNVEVWYQMNRYLVEKMRI